MANQHDRSGASRRRKTGGALAGMASLAFSASLASAQYIGPSTTVDPYLVPSIADAKTTSVLTVGDLPANNGYRMVGIPDGLGAFRLGSSKKDQSFTLLMNHELVNTVGIPRAHGSKGAFVSEWSIDRRTLEVINGRDLTDAPLKVHTWNGTSYVSGTTAWSRFCSADLPAEGALYLKRERNALGTADRIFFNGEEITAGRAFAHVASGPHAGESWQLPRLGRIAFENVLVSPYAQEKTVIVTMDDSSANTFLTKTPDPTKGDFPSELHVYIGAKQGSGHPIEQAGLTNGKLYGVKVFLESDPGNPLAGEDNTYGLGNAGSGYIGHGRFTLEAMGNSGDVSAMNEVQFQQDDVAKKIFRMQRIEDGAWDPRKSNADDFYFVTTASMTSNSRLWRLRFDDIKHPELGGTIEILLKGDEDGHKMFDNITVDTHGRIILLEDVGNDPRLGRVWLYGIGTGNLVELARHNPAFFDPANPDQSRFLTQDEESSGVIDAEKLLGRGWFLLDVQNHKASTDTELVEGGQLLALYVDPALEASNPPDDEEDD